MKQGYKVIRPFAATAPISGTRRQFSLGEMVGCDTKEPGSTLTLEVGEGGFTTYYFVERPVFNDCCKWMPGSAA
ncbi:MAG TPA: hypothetical protein VMF66_17410 [Candidatus Acidoferrum sp.]|nr:hypothetical protein [Candidatus Acidoferrum sp.]